MQCVPDINWHIAVMYLNSSAFCISSSTYICTGLSMINIWIVLEHCYSSLANKIWNNL